MGISSIEGIFEAEKEVEKTPKDVFFERMADFLRVDYAFFQAKIAPAFERFRETVQKKLKEERDAEFLSLGMGNGQRTRRLPEEDYRRSELTFLWQNLSVIFACTDAEAIRFVWPALEEFLFIQKNSLFAASVNQSLTASNFEN